MTQRPSSEQTDRLQFQFYYIFVYKCVCVYVKLCIVDRCSRHLHEKLMRVK